MGDFIECGVWRGGMSIFARAIFVAYEQKHRKVILADSFSGLPPSTTTKVCFVSLFNSFHLLLINVLFVLHFQDTDFWASLSYVVASEENVRANFRRMSLLHDTDVLFLKGYFNVTMKLADKKFTALSVLRLDGDMYESCIHIIINLYDHVSVGGFVIIDDYFGFPCREAVDVFRKLININETIVNVDNVSAYWRKMSIVTYDKVQLLGTLLEQFVKRN